MNRLWMMIVLTIKDSMRAKAWIPLAVMSFVAWFPMLIGFGYRLNPSSFANNIISNYFQFFSFGVLLSAVVLGATAIPLERRASALLTLPISRMEIALGKLFGSQLIVGCGFVLGYLISLRFAAYNGLTELAYSRLGLATVLTLSFTYLCLSIPLGFWLSPVPAALTAWLVINVPAVLEALVDQQWITTGWLVRAVDAVMMVAPGQLDTAPFGKAFYNIAVYPADYASVGRNVFLALAFFILLTALARRKELSTKS